MLSPKRDAVAAKHFLQMAVWRVGGLRPRVIHVDGHPAYLQAIRELKASGELSRRCRCRPSSYLNNVLEQDHRFLQRRMAARQWFRSVEGALRAIAGYEAMNMIRKGQIRWLAKGDTAGVRSVTSSRFSGSLLNTIFRSPSNSFVQTYLRQILNTVLLHLRLIQAPARLY